MTRVNVQEAKTQFSKYLDRVSKGETIIVCKHNIPVAELRPVGGIGSADLRPAGLWKGQVSWTPGAFDPMTDEEVDEFFGETSS